MSCLLPGRPVIFTSCHLYSLHVVEYWAMTWIFLLFGTKKQYFPDPLLPLFIVLKNHSNADKIVLVVLPDYQPYSSFLYLHEFFWIYNASEKIHRFVQHNLNNPNSLSTTKKKILRLTLHNRNNANNLF